MSRPQKIHKPLKGGFNEILGAVALGKGKAKRMARKAAAQNVSKAQQSTPKKDC
jgi:hypothetical protein